MCQAAGAAKFAVTMAHAEAGDASAMYDVGLFYAEGTGVAADARETVKWYTRAAEAGHTDAEFNLGVC